MYQIEQKLVPQLDALGQKRWFTPAESNAYYKTPYAREGITIHWWGDGTGADNHDNIVRFFQQRTDQGSVHFVLSDNKITQMVDTDNVAFTSQTGNPTTIAIEHQPTLTDEGYKKSGWLVYTLEKKYNKRLTLYPHKHWYSTACPGSIDIARIRAEADKFHAGGTMEKSTLTTARIIAHGVMGRNGLDGSPNALDGSSDADLEKHHVGKDLTNQYIFDRYMATEAELSRKKIADVNAKLATIPTLTAENKMLKEQNATLQAKVDAIENDDAIIITRSGWNGLFDYIKQWIKGVK